MVNYKINTCLCDCKVLKVMQKSEQLVRPELYVTHSRKRSRYSSEETLGFTNLASMEIAVPLNKLVYFAEFSF